MTYKACCAESFTCLHMSALGKPGLSQKPSDLTLGHETKSVMICVLILAHVENLSLFPGALLHWAVRRASRRHGRAIHREEQGHEGQRTSGSSLGQGIRMLQIRPNELLHKSSNRFPKCRCTVKEQNESVRINTNKQIKIYRYIYIYSMQVNSE